MSAYDFFSLAHRLEQRGEPFVTATVVRIERPTSGKPGDRAIVTRDGELHGWIGGSCTRPTIVREALGALESGESRLIRLSSEPEEQQAREGITDLSMTCFSGGTMEIFIEPNPPRPRLTIVGDQPAARALAALGRTLGYEVVGVGDRAGLPEADRWIDSAEAIGDDAHPLTAVVVASHGDQDEVTLEHALQSKAPYVGLIASPKRAESIRGYLKVRGLEPPRIQALRAPAGLDIHAREPEEIALSILAEIVQLRRTTALFEWRTGNAESEVSGTVVDPVCGMEVEITGSRHSHEHDGTTYHFCCSGCRTKFAEQPATFV